MVTLAPIEVDLHLASAPDRLARLAARADLLDADEQARAARQRRDRDLYIAAHVLLRHALSVRAPLPADHWRFTTGLHGRPELAGAAAATGLRFNLSHTAGLVCCAVVAGCPVGVDAERYPRRRDALALARRFFTGEEAATLAALDEAARSDRFLALWVLKEAHLKALGLGIAGGLDRFTFTIEPGSPSHLQVRDRADPGACWQSLLLEDGAAGWVLALALPTAAPVRVRLLGPGAAAWLAATPGLVLSAAAGLEDVDT